MDIRWKRTKTGRVLVVTENLLSRKHLELDISASPEAWLTLSILSFAKPEYVLEMIRNVSEQVSKDAFKREKRDFVNAIKWYTIYIYYWTDYWLKKPQSKWPDSLKKLSKEVGNKSRGRSHFGKEKKPRAISITQYCMEKYFGKERRKHGLKPFTDDEDSFRRTYITNNKFAEFAKAKLKEFVEDSKSTSPLPF